MISEKAEEWGLPVWMASLDFEKAFDKVHRSSVVEALQDAGVDAYLVRAVWMLYSKTTGYVHVDRNTISNCFDIAGGVRQGDPMSPILFNNVTRIIFRQLQQSWRSK
eukprot:2941634-Karenia_brevis.AAC.1